MTFEFHPEKVPLSAIDSEAQPFRITTKSGVDDLVSAFMRVGLTSPPILKPATGGYHVVCGYRRVTAARSIGWQSIPANILPEDTDALSCALLAISENSIERSLNLIETSRALSLLDSLIAEKEDLLETSAKFGLPGSPSLLKKILPLCRLPVPLQEGLLSGTLAMPVARMLSNLPTETAVAFAEFLITLKLSLHKQRELTDIVVEISKRDECSVVSVLTSPEICRILDDPDTDQPRKAGQVREYLRKRRFPSLTRTMAEFEALKGRLKLGENVSLKPPAGFESNRYTISLTVGSPAEFENQRKTLEKLAQHDEFIRLLESRNPLER